MLNHARRALRARLPEPLRASFALARRGLGDALGGQGRRLVRPGDPGDPADFPHSVCALSQDIRQSPFWEGKLANIGLGAERMDGVVVPPGAVLSFWALVGRPDEAAGFAMGRGIRGDATGGEIGGGLCQLSGMAYELGLRAGLDPVERHAHSRDLYAEHERFTPLGLDATVVWPWKDLRLANRLPVPLRLSFAVEDMTLRAAAHAARPIAECAVAQERRDHADHRAVTVTRTRPDGASETVSCDRYAIDRPFGGAVDQMIEVPSPRA